MYLLSVARAVLVVDNEMGIAARFLPYSGANVLEAMSPANMEPERIRLAVMGAVRFNKPLCIDLGQCDRDMFEPLKQRFEQVQPGLWQACMNRDICKREE